MIDWQSVAMALASLLSSWAIWEIKRVRKDLHDLRDQMTPIATDVAFLKGYQQAKNDLAR